MRRQVIEKLEILADAAKYDVSCASSGSTRKNTPDGLGNSTGLGICHSYTPDGRCVSLLKILFTNVCIYDCAYCVSRRSNDVQRVAFTVEEVVDLTLGFYRRNYIEGLFLSSGIFKDADTTTEKLVAVARKLRTEHRFNGYIHLKVIPGASDELVAEAGLYADRLSVNLEIPSEQGLRSVAPEKDYASALGPMAVVGQRIAENREDYAAAKRLALKRPPKFAPGGQSTQLVIGATPETTGRSSASPTGSTSSSASSGSTTRATSPSATPAPPRSTAPRSCASTGSTRPTGSSASTSSPSTRWSPTPSRCSTSTSTRRRATPSATRTCFPST